jgi:hypothetical protein
MADRYAMFIDLEWKIGYTFLPPRAQRAITVTKEQKTVES